MGLFSTNPSSKEQEAISQLVFQVQSSYRMMFDGCGIDNFVYCKKTVLDGLSSLVKYEKKYPKFFKKPLPTDNFEKVNKELPACEKKFINYTLDKLERKLLNYTTDKGKRNNFNKEVDIFHYHSGEFLPDTVIYFEEQLRKRFTQYI